MQHILVTFEYTCKCSIISNFIWFSKLMFLYINFCCSARTKETHFLSRSKANNSSTMSVSSNGSSSEVIPPPINADADRYPFCIVWTPIPVLTWFFPFIGHMGIAMSNGVIRDFAGPYFVSEDNMAFGRPTRYLVLNVAKVRNGSIIEWDEAVSKASVVYGTRMHNLFWDNCHSHVGLALSNMNYDNSTNWNMVRMAAWMFFCGKYVSFGRALLTWLPFLVILSVCTILSYWIWNWNWN